MTRKLLVLANNVEEVGGVQRVAHLLGSGLQARGWDVELCGVIHADDELDLTADATYPCTVLYDERPPKGHFPTTLRGRLDVPRQVDEVRRRLLRRRAVERLEGKLRDLGDGFVLCMQVYAAEHLAEARPHRARVVGQYHDSYAAAVSSTDMRRLQRVMGDLDAFLLLTDEDARLFQRAALHNVGVMPNPVSFPPGQLSTLDAPVVMSAGRYHEQKALDRLLDAWVEVHRAHPEWQLRLFGAGPLEGELREQVQRLGLQDTAHLMGTTDDVRGELLKSSVYAMSSRHEGLPMVLTEAMSCGVPCVAMDCAPGIAEIVTHEVDGLVTPPADVAGLAAGLLRLVEDEQLRRRLGAAAPAAVARFGLDSVLDRWESLFAQVAR